ncbi:MAG: DNA-directed RNA polymerase subunit beta, partial [Patescibacteria group bacterium]
MAKKKEADGSVKTPALSELGAVYEVKGRYFFTDDRSILEIPNLIEVQTDSYQDFLNNRLEKAFKETFPIQDFSGEKIDIYYKGFTLDEPKHSVADAKRKNLNFEAPLKVRLEMLNKQSGEIKEQDVYMGGLPLMTEKGTFVINGVERIIVNQIIRSTGMFFVPDVKNPGGFAMKVIPQKGSWFEIEIEKKGVINVKIDKKRKIPVSVLLRAYGLENDSDILGAFKGNKEFIAKYVAPTIDKDKTKTRMEALYAIYKLLRPGDLGTDERVSELFRTTFF